MHTNTRSHMATGAALLTASAIAIAPVVVTPALQDIRVASPAVALSATVDPITRWLEVFNDSEVNFAGLANSWLEAPAPILQQVIANQLGYLGELPDIGAIIEQVVTNAKAALAAPFATDLATMDELRKTVYDLMLDGIPPILPPFVPAGLKPLVEFTTTYLSGALIGLAGLVVNPALALANGLGTAFSQMFGENPDLAAAINTIVNIPADMVDSFLNGGQSINITPLLSLIGELPIPGMGADIVFGGLLSPGGTAFNSIAIDFGDGSGIPAIPSGFIGSMIALSKVIAKALGWDGVGNPLAPAPQEELRAAADISLVASPTVTLDIGGPDTAGDIAAAESASSTTGTEAPAPEPTPTAPVTEENATEENATDEDVTEEVATEEDVVDDDVTEEDPETVVDEDGDLGEDETGGDQATEDEATDSDDASDAADSEGGDSSESSDAGE